MNSGTPVASYGFSLKNVLELRDGTFAVAYPGLEVVRNPDFKGDATGRVCDGLGRIVGFENELGCLSVFWKTFGDKTTWTRASDGEFDVVTS